MADPNRDAMGAGHGSRMNRERALELLGLDTSATAEQIESAHRRLVAELDGRIKTAKTNAHRDEGCADRLEVNAAYMALQTSEASRFDPTQPSQPTTRPVSEGLCTVGGYRPWLLIAAILLVIAASVTLPRWRGSVGVVVEGNAHGPEAKAAAETGRARALASAASWEDLAEQLPTKKLPNEADQANLALATGDRHLEAGAYAEAEVAFRQASDLYEALIATATQSSQLDPNPVADAARERYQQLDTLELQLHGRIADVQRKVDEYEQTLRQARTFEERARIQTRQAEAEAELALLTRLKALAYTHVFHPSLRSEITKKLAEADECVEIEQYAKARASYAAIEAQLTMMLKWPEHAESALRQQKAVAEELGRIRSDLGPMGRGVADVDATLEEATGQLAQGNEELTAGRVSEAMALFESALVHLRRAKALTIDGLLSLAGSHHKEGELTAAALALNELLILDPDHAAARELRQRIVSDRVTNSVGMELVFIPPGEFIMGSPPTELGRDDDERQRTVVIDMGFYMGVTEVTQSQWQVVTESEPSNWKGEQLPVEQVSWEDAVAFCQGLSEREGRVYRLPTEAEWEYCCRAGTTTPFAFGMVLSTEQANFDGEYPYGNAPKGIFRDQTVEVSSFPPNPWGLYDMHGNVWEWCLDGGQTDPAVHVLRGGSWRNRAKYCRCANRVIDTENSRLSNIGFRVVLESE